MPVYTYVDLPDQTAARIAQSADAGVDTEFMRERTFYSQLCLVQVACDSDILIVDPLTDGETGHFWDALLSRNWVAHSARQDIEVVVQTAGRMPAALFDTQVAAALLGHAPQLGYAGLVKTLFDVELKKSHTRANWAKRPLPDEYLDYAAEDVEYLLPARDKLAEDLDRKGRLAWAQSDSAQLLDPALYELDPATAAGRLKSLRNLTGARRAAAIALAAWRETEAMRRNLPRQWILKDAVLTDVAVKLPATRAELERIDGLPPKVVKRAGDELLAAIAAARQSADERGEHRSRRGAPDEQQKSVLQAMQARVAECASDLGVAAETIASKKELSAIILEGERDTRVFSGWRKSLIGDRLAQLL
jgi:ribonuclease D